jgi:hypothetical protein
MKKNLPLITAIAIPAALILFVAASIYIPGIFVKPQYNFLYATGSFYAAPYKVTDGHLVTTTTSTANASGTVKANNSIVVPVPGYLPADQPSFYIYDVATNQSRQVSPTDAAQLSLDTNEQSPDGFTVATGNAGGGIFPFFSVGSDYGTRYLEGHNVSRKLNLSGTSSNYPYSYNFTFIGWIQNQ